MPTRKVRAARPAAAAAVDVAGRRRRGGGGGGRGGASMDVYNNVLHDPAMRDPRGFIMPSDQPDFLTATKFVNTLIKAGVDRASRDGGVHGGRQELSGRFLRRQERRRRSART